MQGEYTQLGLLILLLWTSPGAAAGLLTALLRGRGVDTAVVNTVLGAAGSFGAASVLATVLPKLGAEAGPKAPLIAAFVATSMVGGLTLIWIACRLFGSARAAG